MSAPIALGAAVELPEGIFKVVGEWRYSGMALQWWLWELDTGEGQTRLLARMGKVYYAPRFEEVGEWPPEGAVEFEGTQFERHDHGEARVEHSLKEARDFWVARFQLFTAPGRVLIFTEDRRVMHRLTGDELGAGLVTVYQG